MKQLGSEPAYGCWSRFLLFLLRTNLNYRYRSSERLRVIEQLKNLCEESNSY